MLRTPSDLGGLGVVVTGASSDIGRATAVALAERGARVSLAARSGGVLEEVARECRAAGGEALAVPIDVSDEDAVQRLAARAAETYGRIDAWVNNAAVMTYGRFEETPSKVHRHVIETNLIGPIEGARAVLPYFREQSRVVLVNVASQYGRITSPQVSAYVVSKFGMIGFSEVLRQELAGAPGIHDVAVCQFARLLSLAHALAPGLYDRLVPQVMTVAGFRRATVPTGPGNVFEPSGDWQQVVGGWRRRRHATLAAVPAIAAAVALVVAARARTP